MNTRSTSLELWNRICDLVVLADSSTSINRVMLARRWGCTVRNVSYVMAVAEQFYGIVVEWTGTADDGTYVLADSGVLDVKAIKRMMRRNGRR